MLQLNQATNKPGDLLLFENLFPICYLAGLIVGSFIRAWYVRKYKQDRQAIFREEGFVAGILASLWGVSILLPPLYIFTRWFNFADFTIPTWIGWVGVVTFTFALWLLWRSHADLGRNWRVTTEIAEGHKLVTSGVFRYIRHPMYSAHFLWGIAQALLINNWIAGLASLVVMLPMYLLRVRREEQMMLEQFGEEYRLYMKRTGRIIPRLSR
ncbi:protein-S-isoprenylcysteine O-methyltransferase [Chloroflexota bacterium]